MKYSSQTSFCLETACVTPKGCERISQGLSAAQPLVKMLPPPHPARVRVSKCDAPGVRKERAPLANFLAPLRGARPHVQ
jgi:hypothetical protein